MNNNTTAPTYTLRGLQLIGWRDMQHALDYLFADGQLKQGTLVAINAEKMLTIRLFRQTERTDTIRYRFFLFIQTLSPCEPLSPADPSSLCRVRCMKYP